MNFGQLINDANRAYAALNGVSIMSDQAYENMARGAYQDTTLAMPPASLPPDYPEDTTAADTAYEWIRRCRESEDAAFDVMTEIEITEHGDFVKKAMHLLSNVGPYTDRNKIVNELAEALDETLKACANHE